MPDISEKILKTERALGSVKGNMESIISEEDRVHVALGTLKVYLCKLIYGDRVNNSVALIHWRRTYKEIQVAASNSTMAATIVYRRYGKRFEKSHNNDNTIMRILISEPNNKRIARIINWEEFKEGFDRRQNN